MDNFVLHGMRLPWPAVWADVFEREAPVIMEIGFGSGNFLVDLAQKRPLAHFVGVEISVPSLRKAAKKVRQTGLSNVRLIQGGAPFILQAVCPPESLEALYINFPDPWPKATHQRRRLINVDFLHLAATRMKAGAWLEIGTDHGEYAEVITAVLQQTPYFESRLPTPFVTEDKERYQTKYELKGLAEGRVCHYYKWQRNEVAAPNNFSVPKEANMPHVILKTSLNLAEVSQQFEPFMGEVEGVHVKYLSLFEDSREGRLLVEAYVNEEPMRQRVGLTIRLRDEGDWVVGLHEIGFPRPTYGVQVALYYLAQWLRTLQSDMVVVKSNLPLPF